jgi:glucose-6-phosphate-specific signal transduction histidine kinase
MSPTAAAPRPLTVDAGRGGSGGAAGAGQSQPIEGHADQPQRQGEICAAEAANLRVELDVEGEPGPLPAPVDLAAYRIIQEALTNVIRHAEAHTVRLVLTHEPSRLFIRIRDDGPTTSADTACGHGIDGMRERARALSGQLTAAPHPDGGFEVRAELPIPHPRS